MQTPKEVLLPCLVHRCRKCDHRCPFVKIVFPQSERQNPNGGLMGLIEQRRLEHNLLGPTLARDEKWTPRYSHQYRASQKRYLVTVLAPRAAATHVKGSHTVSVLTAVPDTE